MLLQHPYQQFLEISIKPVEIVVVIRLIFLLAPSLLLDRVFSKLRAAAESLPVILGTAVVLIKALEIVDVRGLIISSRCYLATFSPLKLNN